MFKSNNYRRIKNNISNQERTALKDIQKDTSETCRMQNKGSRFVVLDSDSYIEKIDRQLKRSSFQQLDYHPSDEVCKKVTSLVKKRKQNKVLNNGWCRFIETSQANPGKMYGLIKTHNVGNPVRVITNGCRAAIENLAICVEKYLYSEVLKIESRVKDTSEMLTIINNLNKSNTLTSDCRLVRFNIVNMFPSIDNISWLKTVKNILDARQDQFASTASIIVALKLCLECNNSILNNKHFLQSDDTAQGLHMFCLYSDIAIQYFVVKALEYTQATICWKRFRDDIFIA